MIGFIIVAIFYVLPIYAIVKFVFFSDNKLKEAEPSKIILFNYRLKPKKQTYYREPSLVEIRQNQESKEKLVWLMKEWKLK